VAASYLKRHSNKKLFVRLHRYEAFTEFPLLIKWENVDGVVFVSNFMRNILESRGVDLKDIHVRTIYNGVDLERLKFKPRENGYNIGWVAHIILRKNLHIALEIIKKLRTIDSRYTLHVAGDFPDPMYEIYLKHMVKELNLEENVIFYGWVDDIDEWWEDKNYLLSTSIHESFGYNIVEAMAKGIKPIIHNFYDARELFPDELLFNTTDEAVEKITKGAYDSESYRKYVIERGWTIEKQVSEFKKFLNTLIAEKGGFIE
jgi:glycosyltransferase involved in cell wall biosynthesis